jgi:hypothetical protein
MVSKLDRKGAFGYFRMGLVTGIVEKQELIQWADREIIRSLQPEHEIIELSLCGRRPHSEILWLLSSFEGELTYGLSLRLLLARAGLAFERDPTRARELILGLRLLKEEAKLPKGVKSQLVTFQNKLQGYERGSVSLDQLGADLSRFLERYAKYRPLLFGTVYPQNKP